MDLICIGDVVNTHGIKGELRIISEFKYKNEIFKKGFKFYIGRFEDEVVLKGYRKHKNFDMLTFDGIDNINDVLQYKGEKIYIKRKDLNKDLLLNEDLIEFEVMYTNKSIGKLIEIINNNAHEIFVIEDNNKTHLVPYIKDFIEKIDIENKKIYLVEMSGLINEDWYINFIPRNVWWIY